jgi:biotin-dependent carboxylase-like uncharacterized protein
MNGVLKILHPGGGCSLQDLGRPGWKRFGVPEGGAMDREAARQANRLVGNPDGAAVLEIALTGARFQVLQETEFALTGADAEGSHPRWCSFVARAGEEIVLRQLRGGVWSYLAVAGGFEGPRWLGSRSVNARAGFGTGHAAGSVLTAGTARRVSAIKRRFVAEGDRPQFSGETEIPVWPGPEWELLPAAAGEDFLCGPWTLSSQSDRTGYRMEGPRLALPAHSMLSSPVTVGTVQLPPGGKPIVILRDGPTVGGYPRLAILDPSAVSLFVQCAPGTVVRFHLSS